MALAMQLAMDLPCLSGDHGKPTVYSRQQIRDATQSGVQTTCGLAREEVLFALQVVIRCSCLGPENAL